MSKETLILIFGVLVFVVALLGIPASWKVPIQASLGALVVLFGYLSMRAHRRVRPSREHAQVVSEYRAEETPLAV